jgi:hypothetical protein
MTDVHLVETGSPNPTVTLSAFLNGGMGIPYGHRIHANADYSVRDEWGQ